MENAIEFVGSFRLCMQNMTCIWVLMLTVTRMGLKPISNYSVLKTSPSPCPIT
jgi:hypothetical protein